MEKTKIWLVIYSFGLGAVVMSSDFARASQFGSGLFHFTSSRHVAGEKIYDHEKCTKMGCTFSKHLYNNCCLEV